jgi:hypothetical protein
LLKDCANGKLWSFVEWMWRVEDPEAESRDVEVAAREKMSVMCAKKAGVSLFWR